MARSWTPVRFNTRVLLDGYYLLRLAYRPPVLDVDIIQTEKVRIYSGIIHFERHDMRVPWVNRTTDLGGATRVVGYLGPYRSAFEMQYVWNTIRAE
jgi:hypothetical protein